MDDFNTVRHSEEFATVHAAKRGDFIIKKPIMLHRRSLKLGEKP